MPSRHSIEKTLPIRDLAGDEFERLCLELLEAEGFTSVERLGGGTRQHGLDLLAREGESWVGAQCKCRRDFPPSLAAVEVAKLAGLPPESRPDRYLLAVTVDLSLAARDAVMDGLPDGVRGEIWGLSKLDGMIKRHGHLLDRYFSGPAAGADVLRKDFPVPWRIERPPLDELIERPQYEEAVKALVATAGGPRPVGITASHALRGAGGFGKTTLARALAHSDRVRRAFPSGVLWLEFGAEATEVRRIEAVRKVFAALTGRTAPRFATSVDAGDALGSLVLDSDLRLLVILDDVWSSLDYRPLIGLAPAITLLLTTRLRTVLPRSTESIDVDTMAGADAIAMLARGLPAGSKRPLYLLAEALGGWPLLLDLVNRYVLDITADGMDRNAALELVRARLEAGGITALDPEDPEARDQAVAFNLDYSLDRIARADDRARAFALAIFPEDVAIPLRHAADVWELDAADAHRLGKRLRDLSILQAFDGESMGLHDVIRKYFRERLDPDAEAAHRRLLDANRPRSGAWFDLPADRGYLWKHLGHHLARGAPQELATALGDGRYLEAKLDRAGVVALLSDFRSIGVEHPLAGVGHALKISRHILNRAPEQLAAQILGRVSRRDDTKGVRASARRLVDGRRPYPLHPSIGAPAGLDHIFDGHRHAVTAVAVTPEGRVVSAGDDNCLRVWNLLGDDCLILGGHTDVINGLAVLPDGLIVSASSDGTLRAWNIYSHDDLVIDGDEDSVNDVAAMPDGRFASAGADGSVRIWDLDDLGHPVVLRGHDGDVNAVTAMADGRVASAGRDGTVRVWNLDGGNPTIFEGHGDWVNAVAALPDGRIVSGSEDETVRIWSLDGREPVVFDGHSDLIDAVTALPDGRFLSASFDGTVRIWSPDHGPRQIFRGHTDAVHAIAATPDGRVISGGLDNVVRVWRIEESDKDAEALDHEGPVNAVTFLADGRIVSAGDDATVRIWPGVDGSNRILEGHTASVDALAVLADGRIVSGGFDKTLRLWDVTTGESVCLEGHGDYVHSAALLPDGRLVSGSVDGTVRLWTLDTGEHVIIGRHGDWVSSVAVAPGGRIVSGGGDHTLRLWSLDARALKTFEGHSDPVCSVAVLPDGTLVSGGQDNTVRLWDVDRGLLRVLDGHSNWVCAVAATGDGRLVTGSEDRSIRVWDLETGRSQAMDFDAGIRCVATARRRVIAGDGSGKVHELVLPPP
ncbi:MAG: NB-ARC domain-containing protein [Acidobacteriota bacterium]